MDSDGSIPLEPSQKNQTENSPASPQNCDAVLNHCEKETKKRIQREHSVDVSPISPRFGWLPGAPASWGWFRGRGGNRERRERRAVLAREEELRWRDQRMRRGAGAGTPGASRGFHEISESQNWCWCQGVSLCLICQGQGWWQRWLLQPEEGWRVGCGDSDPAGCVSLSSCFCLWRSPGSWSVQFLLCKSSNRFWFLWNKKKRKVCCFVEITPRSGLCPKPFVSSFLFS